ncbi:hypothetical protein F511_20243 [Dorcoceras hygrometricum]|uniref:Uncharacterized protein n=1 Tax=Dorcoceras hygrometricum TaxID=472368 RepID=A0A2Z7C7T2_9LAMI|nr:hypothetical protein F511_20243 [Dorcoceras hygrometricum]
MAIKSLTTLDLPMIVDSIGIYVMKGPYYMLTMTNWFLQALVIPRGSWDDVARRFTMVRWGLTNWFLQALVIPRGSWDDVARRFTMVRWVDQKMYFLIHNELQGTQIVEYGGRNNWKYDFQKLLWLY